jgi:predicted RNase H-like nuclease (RuvC/YqgF family)
MTESWSEWFTFEVKRDLREKITNFEDVWSLMFLSPDKQEILDAAARVAQESIAARNREIEFKDQEIAETEGLVDFLRKTIVKNAEQHERELEERDERIRSLERHLESQQMSNFMAPTIISDLTKTTIDQFKEIQRLKALLNPE